MIIMLNSIELVKKFVNVVNAFDGDIDIVSGRYTVDAKSIMGIFSLDLTKPMTVVIHDNVDKAKLEAALAEFSI